MTSRTINATGLARLLGGTPEGRPLYAVLARDLRGLVLDGRLPLRTRLPAERDLAAALGVSRTTVTAAYDALRAEGYVESRQGAGSWTALPAGSPTAARHGLAEDRSLIDLACVAPSAPRGFEDDVAAAVAELPPYACGPGYEPLGLPALREAVAARYTARGVPTLPEQILITTGAQHGLCLVLQAFVRPGDPVLVEAPTYPHALDALRRAGARLVPTGVNAGWDAELITSGLRQSAARLAYLIPDFQNPTGLLMGDEVRAALVAAARATGTYVIGDETFAELALDDVARPRPLAAHDTDGRVISIGSASKVLWGGLRIGWVRATQALVRRLAEAREAVDLASPVFEQLIAARLLGRMDAVADERRAMLRERRAVLVEALRGECPDWTFTVPPGGLSLWVRLPGTSSTVLAAAAGRYGLHVVPGTAFGVDGVLDDHLRLPYVLSPETLRDAVSRLAAASREAAGAPRPRPAFV
ncbi:MocR-like transcription factor YczR [Actinoallomurus rhizosphaericola]|uniref:MocR-like transcription factor YczR n=1 Tax=Actinoallomurus rhizosphaericola TaxID=2952536 RepID=UPI002092052F|nr:PLP-dependent aminotransferase family protein [Actinoallomurus rhizosphaericola]MCO5999299.1 PLP-dependent aminotransferase family protein [Actinoallomurus rhizosphaericola]